MLEKIKKKKDLFKGVYFFYNLLNKNKLVSSEKEFFLLNKIVKKNDSVIDVGANIGRYTFKLSSIVGNNGIVYSFEPVSKIYLILISLIFMKDIKNIIPFNLALSDKSKFLHINVLETIKTVTNNFKFNTFTRSKVLKKGPPNTFALKLDDLKISKKISFIKLDCEGVELEVLKGAKNLIKKFKPTLLVEFDGPRKYDEKMLKYLNSLGYKSIKFNFKSRNRIFLHSSNKKIKNFN
jgi:FkbM family methyltransferase